MTYREFLDRKMVTAKPSGLAEVPALDAHLFDFQAVATEFALRAGRAAMFLDTGLGKTICQLEWARHVPGRVLILAPLAVAKQTQREARERLGLDVEHSRDGTSKAKIVVANYERLHLFDASEFAGVVLDESSILKSFMGKTRHTLCDTFAHHPWRLCCTATPSPNDYAELGNHCEFLGHKSYADMLCLWFTHDSANTSEWRLKGHAAKDFWRWVASWAACIEKPSDVGGNDAPFVLPHLDIRTHTVETDFTKDASEGELFRLGGVSATGMHKEKRLSLNERVEKTVALATHTEPAIIWCETNEESTAFAQAFGNDCVEVKGSDSVDAKEDRLDAFSQGNVRVMVTKPSIAGFGLNWQHCAHALFPSVSYSYESFYQAVRRSWRFGQKRPVRVDVVMAETELQIWRSVRQKMEAHRQMKSQMKQAVLTHGVKRNEKFTYNPNHEGTLPVWLTAPKSQS